ncbi:MAG: LysR family transcriptional regulator [Reyranella sp.]|nr:LysR family transcriptional regulator [Reyranella sp.]MDP3159145.1 LysR family transcriptional regulator [Reyranella sp.]
MNLATLLIAHQVLTLGSVRHAARLLDRPPSTVVAAMRRLQAEIAIPLATTSSTGTQSTLEGVRLTKELANAASLVVRTARLGGISGRAELRAARLSTSIPAIRRFIAVARTGSIRSAAREIGMGQPQLTRQLKAMERELGILLFSRSAKGIVLTKEGRAALALAEALERIWSRISRHAARRFRKSLVVARFGSIIPFGRESNVAKILAVLAAEWHRRTPDDPLFISSTISEELLRSLESRALDAILLDTDAIPSGLNFRIISRSRMMLVGLPRPRREIPSDIRTLLLTTPVALLSLKSGLRQKFVTLMEDVLTDSERERVSFVEADSMPVVANLVYDHGYVTILPELSLGLTVGTFKSIVLPRKYDAHFTIAWRPSPSSEKVARQVLEILKDVIDPESKPH